jgi:hypothetical protein
VRWEVSGRRMRGIIMKLASRRRKVMKALGPFNAMRKTRTVLLLRGIWLYTSHKGILVIYQAPIYIVDGLLGQPSLQWRSSHLCVVRKW